jgi:dienelactone hydrolase
VVVGSARAQEAESPPQIEIEPGNEDARRANGRPDRAQVKVLRQRLADARQALGDLGKREGALYAVTKLSLEAELDRLQRLLRRRRPPCNPTPEVDRLEEDLALAAAGESPYTRPGLHRMAYRSPLDGRVHQFALVVPPDYSSRRQWPLVVMLHGMRSGPVRGIGRLFGVDEARLSHAGVTCDRPSVEPRPTLVVAPLGFGDAFYRLLGERDVHHVVQRVRRLYRVDRRRITITGLSMGGTAAVELAFQRPHLYAGVFALCGYYDRRLDSSTRDEPLLPWERHAMTVQSPVEWAANGSQDLPVFLVHGTRDGPERAKALKERYSERGFPVQVELYPRGHDVWVPGYAGGRGLDMLAKLRKERRPPAQVTLVTGRSRVRRAYWVQIEQFTDYSRWAHVKAQVTGRDTAQVRTRNVTELRLDLPAPRLSRRGRVTLRIDGQELALDPRPGRWTRTVRLLRDGRGWRAVDSHQLESSVLVKRPGLAGPLDDIYFDPILIVYGTGKGQGARLRRVAKKLARYDRRVDVRYPVISDRRYTPQRARGRSVILIGNEATNKVLARLGPRLPIRVTESVVHVGQRTIEGEDIGATFVFPNPDASSWYVRVVAGTTPRSYELYQELPIYLPDYVVFDEQIDGVDGGKIVGREHGLVAGGYFDRSWKLPQSSQRPAP